MAPATAIYEGEGIVSYYRHGNGVSDQQSQPDNILEKGKKLILPAQQEALLKEGDEWDKLESLTVGAILNGTYLTPGTRIASSFIEKLSFVVT